MRKEAKPFLIPLDHPAKPVLDMIFQSARVVDSWNGLTVAGFEVLFSQETSYVKVVRHPLLPGYLLKLYLDDETRIKQGVPGWQWLVKRCEGVARVRKMIKKQKMSYFKAPRKWLYVLPSAFPTPGPIRQPFVLLVTDMNLVSREETRMAWKTVPNKALLDELYYILSHGSGSRFLTGNIPYTRSGKFALIDTEYPKRKISMEKATEYLSPEMQIYWRKLIAD